MTEPFDSSSLKAHLRPMKGGSQYLDVKWRLTWLREEHPNAAIETVELGHEPGQWATFRARVSIPDGGSATGHGSETAADFRDYYEKAETKALGRALASLGFGTQFLPDDDEALADSPVARPTPQGATNGPAPTHERIDRETGEITRPAPRSTAGPAASEKQVNYILALGKERGLVALGDDGKEHADETKIVAAVNQQFGLDLDSIRAISGADARRVLDQWAPPREDRQAELPRPSRPVEIVDETAWTEFWKWARANGVNGAPGFLDVTQKSIQSVKSPQEARDLLSRALQTMPR